MKLTVNNFQSWDNLTITIDGFTVVTGDSDLGKSAIYRAIYGVIRNEISAAQVKLGTDVAEIELQYEGHTVLASRKIKGSTRYIIDGETFTSLGGNVPETMKALNLGTIKIGDNELDPIFAIQEGRQFMLTETPAAMNAILGAFSSTEKLEAGKRAGNQRVAEINTGSKLVAAQIQQSEAKLAKLTDLQAVAETTQTNLDVTRTAVERLMKVDLHANTAFTAHGRIADLNNRIAGSTLPDIEPLAGMYRKAALSTKICDITTHKMKLDAWLLFWKEIDIKPATSLQKKVSLFETAIDATNKVTVVTKIAASVEATVDQWTATAKAYRIEKALSDALDAKSHLETSKATQEAADLAARAERLSKLTTLTTEIQKTLATLDTALAAKVKLLDYSEQMPRLEESLAVATKRIIDLTEEQAKKSGKVCPSCGSVVKEGHKHGN